MQGLSLLRDTSRMKVVAIIQARMGSTRLPGKIMLPLADRPLIEQLYSRVKRAVSVSRVILAIPTGTWNEMRDAYIPFGDFFLFDGDEHDLVARHLACAERYQADVIVRIPGDNPCVDPAYIDRAVTQWFEDLSPFVTNTTAGHAGLWIDGIGAEVFSVSRLRWLDRATAHHTDRSLREHPHKYFCASLPAADIRLDVNTQADYEFISDIYNHFGHNRFTTADVVAYLETKKVLA